MQTWIPDIGKLHKFTIKALKNNQSFSAMVGYVTIDFGKPHYKVVSKRSISPGSIDYTIYNL